MHKRPACCPSRPSRSAGEPRYILWTCRGNEDLPMHRAAVRATRVINIWSGLQWAVRDREKAAYCIYIVTATKTRTLTRRARTGCAFTIIIIAFNVYYSDVLYSCSAYTTANTALRTPKPRGACSYSKMPPLRPEGPRHIIRYYRHRVSRFGNIVQETTHDEQNKSLFNIIIIIIIEQP